VTTVRCADLSEAAGESLAATATTAQNWLLVEVRGTWPRDVAEDGALLDGDERAAADAWLSDVPSSRLLFIRRPGRARAARLAFVVRAGERDTEVRRIELGVTARLGDVDLVNGGDAVETSLVLVCGHGSRDACCALRGTAVYGALESSLGTDALWLSSHQGGHRFAANVLVLPGGVQLGRVSPADAPRVVGEALAGTILLEHYRGRTAYTVRQQAAERAVREERGLVSLSDIAVMDDDGLHVRLIDMHGEVHRARVEQALGPSTPASCGVGAVPQERVAATLV
jgi:hypothetical protein